MARSSRWLAVAVAAAAAALPVGTAVLVGRLDPFVVVAAAILAVVGLALVRQGSDVVTLLTFAIVVQFAIPNRLVFTPLGSAGGPGQLVGVMMAGLWIGSQIVPGVSTRQRSSPIRVAVLVAAAANVASFAAAQFRPIGAVEARAADRGLILTLSMVGICLTAADGIIDRARLDALVRRLVIAGAGLSALGVLAFMGGPDLAAGLSIPGLGDSGIAYEEVRSSFRRVAGTTSHAIEFSVVLSMLLPLALHCALHARSHHKSWWVAAALIGAGIPMSLSRSGTVGIAVAALVLIPSWSRPLRRRAYVIGAGYLVVMRLLFPGLLGTIKALFLNVGVDPSVTSRTQDYNYVGSFVSQAPVFGRGFSTFIPTIYDFLDNQYLVTLIETGVVGLLSLLALFVTGMSVARGVRHRAVDEETRDLGQSLAAGIAVAAVTSGTFDFLGFATARFVLLMLLGCAGALWSLDREQRERPLAGSDARMAAVGA